MSAPAALAAPCFPALPPQPRRLLPLPASAAPCRPVQPLPLPAAVGTARPARRLRAAAAAAPAPGQLPVTAPVAGQRLVWSPARAGPCSVGCTRWAAVWKDEPSPPVLVLLRPLNAVGNDGRQEGYRDEKSCPAHKL